MAGTPSPNDRPEAVVRRFSNLRVLVVGDGVLDVWMRGGTTRVSREAPVPVVEVDRV